MRLRHKKWDILIVVMYIFLLTLIVIISTNNDKYLSKPNKHSKIK